MDPAKQLAITACGRCGQPEDAHKFGTGTDPDTARRGAARAREALTRPEAS